MSLRIFSFVFCSIFTAGLFSCASSLQGKLTKAFRESPNTIESCLAYFKGDKSAMSGILSSFEEEDRYKLVNQNTVLPVKVPAFTYDNFSGRGYLYISNVYDGRISYFSEEEKSLSSKEVIEWKCTERIRIRIDDLLIEAYTIYIHFPTNTSEMFLKIEEASDLYRKLRYFTIGNSEFLRQYLYYGLATQLNQGTSKYPFACSLFKEAKETNSELAKKSENKQLITATFNVDTSLSSLQRRSGCL